MVLRVRSRRVVIKRKEVCHELELAGAEGVVIDAQEQAQRVGVRREREQQLRQLEGGPVAPGATAPPPLSTVTNRYTPQPLAACYIRNVARRLNHPPPLPHLRDALFY